MGATPTPEQSTHAKVSAVFPGKINNAIGY
jgi:hypothetical protein